MKLFLRLWCALLLPLSVFSQDSSKVLIKGKIRDAASNEALIGATVIAKPGGKGTVADLDGNFQLILSPGNYEINISYVGYQSQSQKIKAKNTSIELDIRLQSNTLDEVEVVANIAQIRETPVAFSTISQKKIAEELGSRDLVMVMNTTPGVYATEQGGGSGDARVNVRGFDQRNIAVLVDGVPVNDMENGWVYWSNWDGLGEITRTMQVQRGLGASRLAIASVGGTMNIITQGIETKMQTTIKQEMGNNNFLRTAVSFNSGLIDNKFGLTLAGSYKRGDGWVQQTWTEAWSYYGKFQWRINDKHLLAISGNGAPQKHGQRTDALPIAIYDKDFANKLGIDADSMIKAYFNPPTGSNITKYDHTTPYQGERGIDFNPGWGYLHGKPLTEKVNFYHKPLVNLNHYWNINRRLNLSSVVYYSSGNGGGVLLNTSIARDTASGLLNFQNQYNVNSVPSGANTDNNLSPGETYTTRYLRASMNNHRWIGGLSTLTFRIDSNWTYTGGIDIRHYRGLHFRTVYDMLGADYVRVTIQEDKNMPWSNTYSSVYYKNRIKREGDKISDRNFDAVINWFGAFSQAEYKTKKWSAFVTVTGNQTSYQRFDYFKRKDLVIDGKVFEMKVGYGDKFFYNGTDTLSAFNLLSNITQSGDTTFVKNLVSGQTRYIIGAKEYTFESEEARTAETRRRWFLGYTIKGGANYNLNSIFNIYFNGGYMTMPMSFDNVFSTRHKEFIDVKNQNVYAVELGMGMHWKKLAANLNTYYTYWANKPYQGGRSITTADGTFSYNINGMNARHMGIELDAEYSPVKYLDVELIASYGDWVYDAAKSVYIYDENDVLRDSLIFSAKGVHVGDAAQSQFGLATKIKPIKGLYIKPRFTYFGKNYSRFDPFSLEYRKFGSEVKDYRDRESWKMPDYALLDLSAGYEYFFSGIRFNFNITVSNLLNTKYITDANNNAIYGSNGPPTGQGFNAQSATVFFGQGRRWTAGIKVTF